MNERASVVRRELLATLPVPLSRSGLHLLRWRQRLKMRLWESSLGSVLGIKRVLDIVLSGIALILGFPLLALVALLVYLDDPGPIFYTQTRRGSEKGIRRTSEPARGC